MSEEERAATERIKVAKAEQLAATSEQDLLTTIISSKPYIPPEEAEAELKVRQIRVTKQLTAALTEFKTESATASNRLETLTKWLIVFTAAVVLLTVVLAVRDMTR